ncbi:MAG: hypothetical protein AB1757_10085 [Acidobacteriota bacterium]
MKKQFVKFASVLLVLTFLIGSLTVQATSQSKSKTTTKKPALKSKSAGTATALVASGTELKIRINDELSSKTSRVGDKFTAKVLNPSRYEEATVYGHVGSIAKSGKVKGRTTMSLAFDRIKLTDGRSGVMRAQLIRVYGGESDKVDEEGQVQSESRGKQTIKRSGIGAAAGAVLGGIIGGGKGAAIGLILGGAGGAGSLYIEGSKELKIESGTEMLIRVTRR